MSETKAFVKHWIHAYGALSLLLYNNGSITLQSVPSCMIAVVHEKHLHHIISSEDERSNGEIQPHYFVRAKELCRRPSSLLARAGTLAYSYSTQAHFTTGLLPFDLVSRGRPHRHVLKSI